MKVKAYFPILALFFSMPIFAETYYWAKPLNTNLTNSVILNNSVGPGNGFYSWDFGSNFKRHSNWSVSDFSGQINPIPVENFQASINPNAYGSTSVQLNGHHAVLHLHSWSLPAISPSGWYYLAWNRDIQNAYPWSMEKFGSNPMLCIEHSQAVVASYSEGTPQYTGVTLWLSDENNQSLQIGVKSWDNRNPLTYREGAFFDGGGTGYYIGTFYGERRKYINLMPYSNSATDQLWSDPRWYGMCITKKNLTDAINDLNSNPGVNLSRNVSNYKLHSVQISSEIAGIATATKPGKNGWFTLRAAGIYAYTQY